GLVGFFVAYLISATMLFDVEHVRRAALLDPFGLAAFGSTTRYWTVIEKNTVTPPLTGDLLLNRLIWGGLGLLILAFMVVRFRYDRATAPRRRWWRRKAGLPALETTGPETAAALGRARASAPFTSGTAWRQLLRQYRLEARTVLRSTPFVVILAF